MLLVPVGVRLVLCCGLGRCVALVVFAAMKVAVTI
jgi:hypothetical protein